MLRKIIISTLLTMSLSTTGVMAKNNTDHLVKLVSKQEVLSQNIIEAYKKQDKGSSALVVIKALESGQTKLKSDIHNPEIDNLLVFLNICLDDLRVVVKKPYSSHNAQLVADLSDSISEGSQYIRHSLKKMS